jgi:hypothetical protein
VVYYRGNGSTIQKKLQICRAGIAITGDVLELYRNNWSCIGTAGAVPGKLELYRDSWSCSIGKLELYGDS